MISYFRSGPGEWWRFRSDTRYATHTSDYGPEKMIFLVDARGRRQVPTPYPPPPTKTYFIYYDCDHRLCTDVCLPPSSYLAFPPLPPSPRLRQPFLFLWSAATFSARFVSFCAAVCMRLDLHGDSEIMILHSGDEFDRLWKVDGSFFFSFFYILSMIRALEFWKISKKRRGRGDRRGSSFVFFCYTIDRTVELELLSCDRNINGKLYDASVSESSCTYHSWRAHALSRAGGYIRPDYAEGGPINIRRRPLFVRTRSLRSVANFSRDGASPPFRDSSICPIFRCLGRGPIRVDARARLRRFEVDCGYSGWNKKSLIISEGWLSWNR